MSATRRRGAHDGVPIVQSTKDLPDERRISVLRGERPDRAHRGPREGERPYQCEGVAAAGRRRIRLLDGRSESKWGSAKTSVDRRSPR